MSVRCQLHESRHGRRDPVEPMGSVGAAMAAMGLPVKPSPPLAKKATRAAPTMAVTDRRHPLPTVIPAKAGIQGLSRVGSRRWVPAFAGTTGVGFLRRESLTPGYSWKGRESGESPSPPRVAPTCRAELAPLLFVQFVGKAPAESPRGDCHKLRSTGRPPRDLRRQLPPPTSSLSRSEAEPEIAPSRMQARSRLASVAVAFSRARRRAAAVRADRRA